MGIVTDARLGLMVEILWLHWLTTMRSQELRKISNHLHILQIEELFKVKVAKVNVMNYQGKAKRAGRTMKMGRRADWKRAVVTLAEGSIEII